MRICQVMLAGGFGGAERYFVDLCTALARSGHDVLAVGRPGAAAIARLPALPGLRIATVPVMGAWDPFAVRRLRALLKEHGTEIVDAQLSRAAHIAGRAAAPLHIPVIVKVHNYMKLKYFRHVQRFVAATVDQRDHLLRAGVPPEDVAVVPNFSAFEPVARPPAGAAPDRLVATGRLVRKKGFHVLIDALALLAQQGVKVTLALAGDGPERSALERRAHTAGVADRVAFAGWQDDVAGFIARGGVYVLPSLDEPFGIAVLEAMAAGVPVIATTTQGPREVLTEDCAWLVPPGDAAALGGAIREALSSPGLRLARAEAALARYRENYSRDVVVPKLLREYQFLLDSRRPAGG